MQGISGDVIVVRKSCLDREEEGEPQEVRKREESFMLFNIVFQQIIHNFLPCGCLRVCPSVLPASVRVRVCACICVWVRYRWWLNITSLLSQEEEVNPKNRHW